MTNQSEACKREAAIKKLPRIEKLGLISRNLFMRINIKEVLTDKINKSEWWHVTPADPDAYSKRGKFLASTYHQAEFYGRPNDIPDKVFITNPVYGFSETEILLQLFP